MVKNMHSKWADACGQVICFDRSLTGECDLTSDPFCCHIVRLFSQMSAMATMRLHVVEPGESVLFEALESRTATETRLGDLGARARRMSTCSRGQLAGAKASAKVTPATPDKRRGSSSVGPQAALDAVKQAADASAEAAQKAALGAVAQVASQHHLSGDRSPPRSRQEKISELAAGITKMERKLLLAAPEPVFATAQRIQRAIITRLHAGGVGAPPPIVSRVFQVGTRTSHPDLAPGPRTHDTGCSLRSDASRALLRPLCTVAGDLEWPPRVQ